jgi:hypothetical protein
VVRVVVRVVVLVVLVRVVRVVVLGANLRHGNVTR